MRGPTLAAALRRTAAALEQVAAQADERLVVSATVTVAVHAGYPAGRREVVRLHVADPGAAAALARQLDLPEGREVGKAPRGSAPTVAWTGPTGPEGHPVEITTVLDIVPVNALAWLTSQAWLPARRTSYGEDR